MISTKEQLNILLNRVKVFELYMPCGQQFLDDFNKAIDDECIRQGWKVIKLIDEEMDKSFNYGLHPVTGKRMTEDEFYSIAKKHNWTNEQIFNNLYNSK